VYESIIKDISGLEGACPTCHKKITDDQKKKMISDNEKKVEKCNAGIGVIDKKLADLRVEYNDLNTKKKERDAVDGERLQLVKVIEMEDNTKNMMGLIAETIEKLDEELKEVEGTYNTMLKKLETMPAVDSNLMTSITNSMDAENKKIEDTEDIRNQYFTYIGGLKQKQDQIPQLEEKIKEIDRNADADNQMLMRYKVLQEAYSKNGIPALMIDNMFPIIEQNANAILTQFDNKRSIEFSSVKDNVTGGTSESLDIWINNIVKGTKRLYETYSGGESTGINISLRKALSDLLAKRKYKRLPFLIMDEVFGALDKRHRDLVIQILNLLEHDFQQILVISHTEIQAAFADIIKAKKRGEDTTYVQ